jgi:serine/threonine-protein kinase
VAKVVVKSGRNTGAEFKLNGDHLLIGRRSACPIPIADTKASREHAVILRKDGEFYLQDLSRNGTLLNGMPASKTAFVNKLKFGDQIRIGDTVLEVVDEKSEPIGIEIPGYHIIEKIGQGGMGMVYKAKQLSMDRIVAMKVLNDKYSANSEFVDRFIREARAAGKLNHPNVIHVHDISRANGRHYFSMEFIDGASLKDMLRVEKKINCKKALDIVLQCARALEFAHACQIVHRDVKPDNIMITREGIVKLADLGIAKTFEESVPAAKEHRRVMGTPHYMAPEQALGKPIDHRVDIYSLGATFYHILTGSTPFNGSTAHAILKAHIQESLPPIQDLNAEVPDPVCFIIERMMAKLPEKRYASMTKLIEDMERVQKGLGGGIDRIEAGDSTVLRAAKNPNAAGDGAPTRGPTDDLLTGIQTPLKRAGLALALLAALALTIIAIIVVQRRLASENSSTENPEPPPQTAVVPPPEAPANPVKETSAAKLLQAALQQEQGNPPEYERLLAEVRRLYPAAPEAAEADSRIQKAKAARSAGARVAAQAKLDEARAFEAANSADLNGALNKYISVMGLANGIDGIDDIFSAAKKRHDDIRLRQAAAQAKLVNDAWQGAQAAATAAQAGEDFDSARAALQKFIADHPATDKTPAAQDALNKLNTAAQEKLKSIQAATASMETGDALKAWNDFSAAVKDAAAAPVIAEAARQLEAKAAQTAEDDLKKIGDKARRYEYADAMKDAKTLKSKLRGTKWAAQAGECEERCLREKNLYDRLLAAAREDLKSGPVELAFPIQTKIGNKFKISKCRDDDVFELASPEGAGISSHLRALAPLEQYKFHMQFLKKLTPDDHKSLAAFCADRGLAEEAQAHEKLAAGNN